MGGCSTPAYGGSIRTAPRDSSRAGCSSHCPARNDAPEHGIYFILVEYLAQAVREIAFAPVSVELWGAVNF